MNGSRRAWLGLLSVALLASGCGDGGEGSDAGSDAGTDSTVAPTDAGPEWEMGLTSTDVLMPNRGLRVARGIIHLHTVYSHDACDGMPEINGMPNEPCNQDLRYGLCKTQMDYAFYTDHDDLLGFTAFEDAVLTRSGDEPIMDPVTGALVANRILCADGHRVLTMVGAENPFMPVGFDRHPMMLPPGQALADLYDSGDPSAVAEFEAAGALVLVAHTESRPMAELTAADTLGVEMYNLHANLDPTIRADYLGLPPLGYINDLAAFVDGQGAPDLAFLAFYVPSDNALGKWNELLGIRPTVGVLGTDAHQNVLPIPFSDGERMDSYRRMMRWFSNWLLVSDVDPAGVKGALAAGRVLGVFEILGTPQGFDFFAAPGGDVSMAVEMGGSVSLATSPVIEVHAPTVVDRLPSQPEPEITIQLLRVVGSGTEIVAEGGPGEDVVFTPAVAGVYRAVVSIVPYHWTAYLGLDPTPWLVPHPWIYANPIYVDP